MKDFDEERLFSSRIKDLARSAEKGNICYSDFLTPAERSLVLCMKELAGICRVSFDGGYPEAERVRAKFLPIDFEYEVDSPVFAVEISCRMGEFSHREVLGSVLGLGISRGKIGDIIMGDKKCTVICDPGIASYIIDNLKRVGRMGVKVKECTEINVFETENETITVSVASLRLDIIVAEGFSISRTLAAEMIRGGLCFVNWIKTESPSNTVKLGDVITLRGKGRVKLSNIGGQSRKGKTFIDLLK
ncbi:MAG: RNA-binding protein [Clostridia bacterium]|nr:RNA-binding protein [Clostridia bacterium]